MLQTRDLTPCIGTEVAADRQMLLSGAAAAEIRRLLEARGVLVFRELQLTDEEQLAFGRTLGETLLQGGDDVFKVTLDKSELRADKAYLADYLRGSFYWHIDGSADDVPTRASLLSARRLSAAGGATQFANTYAAYEALPDDEKLALEGVRVVHSIEASQRYFQPEPSYEELMGWRRRYPKKVHPLVWTHQSGRKSLVLGATASYVDGVSLEDGQALLCRLREWATEPRFVYQHEWTLGDLVIWDNTGTMHRATPYPIDSGRLMTRVTLAGEEAIA
jgi:alpha-ketoglutarate-dependent taurine dioxygenase